MDEATAIYHVGISTVDITPPVGIFLAGFAARQEPSTDVYHTLKATVVAITDGNTPLLLIGAEILGFYERTEVVRDRINKATDIPQANIVLNGSHTHCGPCIREMDRERHGELDEEYIESLISKVTRCAESAWNSRVPARLRSGIGHCNIAASRRKPDGKGGVEWKPAPDEHHDHQVPVLTIETPDGDLQGVIFSYACHPTSRGGTSIGGDYVCFAYDRIEEKYPQVSASFLQGCGGDQKTKPVDPASDKFIPREIEEIRQIGEELGEAVIQVIESESLENVSGPITVARSTLDLETEPPDLELVKSSLEDSRDFVKSWAQHMKRAIDSGTSPSTKVPFETQSIRFGRTLGIITLSAEMSVEHGLRLKKDLGPHFDNLLVLGYSNGIVGYVPVKRQIPEGGYEVWFNQQYLKRTGPYVVETEDLIHRTVHQNLGL
jgi:neutral ceramidase